MNDENESKLGCLGWFLLGVVIAGGLAIWYAYNLLSSGMGHVSP